MKLIYIFLICLSPSLTAYCQEIIVSGKTKDTLGNTVPFTTVVLKAINYQDSVFGTLVNENGHFEISVPKSNYQFEFSFMGLAPTILLQDLRIKANQIDLGDVIIQSSILLNEVVVAETNIGNYLEIDKKIYEVSEDNLVNGGSLIDIMQNIPSVQVEVDGKINLRGNGNIQLLIDGRISGLTDSPTLLRTIPAGSIERIEVITNPSSKYSAEGSGGIVNIVIKKGKRNRLSSSIELFTGLRLNTGVNFNLNKTDEKYSWYINSGTGYSEPKATGSIRLITYDSIQSESFQNSEKILEQFYVLNTIGGEYRFNSKNSISTDITYRFADLNTINNLDYKDYSVGLVSSSERFDSEKFKNNFIQVASEYKLKFNDKDSYLKISALAQNSIEDGNSVIIEKLTKPQTEITANDLIDNIIYDKRFTVAVDYVHILKNKAKIEFGTRNRFTIITNDYKVERIDNQSSTIIPEFTDKTNYSENITSFYSQYAKKIEKFKFQIGLRTEVTDIDIYSDSSSSKINRSFTNLFPSGFLDYKIKENENIRFSVSRRINRPRRNALVPFSSFSDSRNLYIGNPSVNPSYTYLWGVSYEKKFNAKITLSPTLFLRNTKQSMDYYIKKEAFSVNGIEEELFITRTVNIGNDKSYGLELSFIYQPNKWFKISNELILNGYQQKGNFEQTNFDINDFAFSGRLHLDFKVSKSFKFQFQNRFRGANNRGQLARKSLYRLDFGLVKSLMKDHASLSLNLKDIFDSWEWDIQTNGNDFSQEITSQVRVPQLNISFIYRWNQKRYQGKKGQQYDRI